MPSFDPLALLAEHGTHAKAAAAAGVAKSCFQKYLKRAQVARHGVQLDADGNVTKQWISTKPEAGEVYAVPAGHTVKGESALIDTEGRVQLRWVKTAADGAKADLVQAMADAFGKYDGAAPVIEAPINADADLVTLYPIPDLHFGMYAYGAETGADYDTSIATQIAERSIGQLVAQSMPSETAVVLVLGDYFHQNDQKNATPGSGHRLDVDGRWSKVYLEGCQLLLSIVNIVARKHQRIVLKVLRGNHDEDAATTLSVAMALFFSSNPRVTVDMSPRSAWYYQHGRALIGAHHGHEIRKPEMCAMAMASDMPEAWGQTEFRYFLTGHIHHESVKEVMGVRVESFSSPAAPDAWNAGSGYRSKRAFTALTYHAEHGEIGRHTVNIAKPRTPA